MSPGGPDRLVSIRFASFRVDVRAGELYNHSLRMSLEPIPFNLLVMLAARPGEVVTREELQQALWGSGVFVDFNNSLNTAISKVRRALNDTASNPRYIETVGRRGYRFLVPTEITPVSEKCLDQEAIVETAAIAGHDQELHVQPDGFSENRNLAPSVSEATPSGPSLVGVVQEQIPKTREWSRRFRARRILAAATVALLAGLVFETIHVRTKLQSAKPVVVVLRIENASNAPADLWLSTALTDMLRAQLGAGENVHVVRPEELSRMGWLLPAGSEGPLPQSALAALRQGLWADYVISGAYSVRGEATKDSILAEFHLQNAATGQTLTDLNVTGRSGDLAGIVTNVSSVLRKQLSLGAISSADQDSARRTVPADPEAGRLYAQALASLRAFDADQARAGLEKAIAINPGHALSHAALSEAWTQLGYDEKAQQEAEKAFNLSSLLMREDRLLIEGQYREATHDWEKARQVYAMLARFLPDRSEYALREIWMRAQSGKPADAMTQLDALRKAKSPLRSKPLADLLEARILQLLGDYKKSQSAAARAIQEADADGLPLLSADVRLVQCRDFVMLGESDLARNACDSARAIFEKAGKRTGASQSLSQLGWMYFRQGKMDEARSMQEEALTISRSSGNRLDMAVALNGIASTLFTRGDLDAALRTYKEALAICEEIQNQPRIAQVQSNLGAVLILQGKYSEAYAITEKALASYRQFGNQDEMSKALSNQGWILFGQGKLPDARAKYEEALTLEESTGNKALLADSLSNLGDLLVAMDHLAEAREKYQRSISLRESLGDAVGVAKLLGGYGEIAIDEGHPDQAFPHFRDALSRFQSAQSDEGVVAMQAGLAGALLRAGRVAEAREEIAASNQLLARIQNKDALLDFNITAACVRAASGVPQDVREAISNLRAARAAAQKRHTIRLELAARLALGKTEFLYGRSSAGRFHLETLEHDASSLGFLLVARQARDIIATGKHLVSSYVALQK